MIKRWRGRDQVEDLVDDGARWLPAKELNPATYGPMPKFARRGRRPLGESKMLQHRFHEKDLKDITRRPPARVAGPVFVEAPTSHNRVQTHTPIPPRRRYSGPMIGTLNAAATTRYYAARAAAARAQGHRLEGGVLGPGSFHASCACGAKLSPGELSAVTTPRRLPHD